MHDAQHVFGHDVVQQREIVDDRGGVELNGVILGNFFDNADINAPSLTGAGLFKYTENGADVAFNWTGVVSGSTGAGFNIGGINTHWQQGVTQLTFPNVLINSYTVNSPTSITANITVNVNAPAGQAGITTTTLGEVASKANAFTISQTQPQLLAAVPSSGVQGETKNVVLTGFATHFVNGTTTASRTLSNGGPVRPWNVLRRPDLLPTAQSGRRRS